MKLINGETQSLRKGTWSPEEDQMLLAYIKRYGIWNWSLMPKAAGLLRSGKSCRLRWMNYLRPTVKRSRLSIDEIQMIIKLQESLGNKWSKIAAKLSGRTDNDIKNFWNTHLRKRVESNVKPVSDGPNNPKKIKPKNMKPRGNETKDTHPSCGAMETDYHIAESFPLSEVSSSLSEANDSLESSCSTLEDQHLEVEGSILKEPYVMENWDEAMKYPCPSFEGPDWSIQDHEFTIQESYINDDINTYWFELFLQDYRMANTA